MPSQHSKSAGASASGSYADFLASKLVTASNVGFEVADSDLCQQAFPFQRKVARWALRLGRCAIFAGTGLGKSIMSLMWSDQVCRHTDGPGLILTPLAVAQQLVREGDKFGIPCRFVRDDSEVQSYGIHVTNYQKLDRFNTDVFTNVILGESSILKAYMGKTKRKLIARFANTPYRLCETATPAPNDHLELGNHAQFLGVMDSDEMISRWFINDSMQSGHYRLKRHAAKDFWRWLSTWACCLSRPSDLGCDDDGFILPPLNLLEHVVTVNATEHAGDMLFRSDSLTATGVHKEMRLTAKERAAAVATVVNPSDAIWVVWCNTNYEADELRKVLCDVVEIRGSEKDDIKERKLVEFLDGKIRVLLTKPSIAGHGLNLQHCHHAAFVGLSFSWEQLYQAIRRLWRFGQKHPVDTHVFFAETEGEVLKTINRKELQFQEMQAEMIAAMKETMLENIQDKRTLTMTTTHQTYRGANWTLHEGDSCQVIKTVPDKSVGFTITSLPFANLYIYTSSLSDMGNSASYQEFFKHYEYLLPELLRVTIPGRLCAVHCKDLPLYKGRDEAAGLWDFPGQIIAAHERHGWTYHSRVTIWKDPVIEMQRTKNNGLLHKTLCRDSSQCRQGMADYLLVFRRFPDGTLMSDEPVFRPHSRDTCFDCYVGSKEPVVMSPWCQAGEPDRMATTVHPTTLEAIPKGYGLEVWQRYASPVWFDIDQTNVLNYRTGKGREDERHICLAKGSLVLTRDGYIPIENVSIGDMVLTHLGRWKPVVSKRCNGIRDVIKVTGHGVASLICTPDHKLFARVGKSWRAKETVMRVEPQWVEASLTLGAYLNLKLPPEEPTSLTDWECWVIGRWLGDGHRGKQRDGHGMASIVISCNHEEAQELIEKLGDHAGTMQTLTATQVVVKKLRDPVRMIIERCGRGAANKRVPGELLTLPSDKARSLLDGYFSADGHYVKRYDRQCASSVSRALLLGIALISQRVYGVVASVYAGRGPGVVTIQGRLVKTKQDWVFAYRRTVGYKQSGWIDDQGAWKKVRRIMLSNQQEVWDIGVEDDMSFTAEGCIVHNCPLQLDVIERSIELWTNPGDLVLDPFNGIGSSGVVALKTGRRYLGIELKDTYCQLSCKHLEAVEKDMALPTLFDALEPDHA